MIYGRIYKIYCNETAECYYGSTIQTLSRRLSKHKVNYKQWKKGKYNYTTSFRIIERGNFTISLLEEGEFQNKDFMRTRERHYIENNECVNKNVPNRTRAEYIESNQEHIAEYNREWRDANPEYGAEYRETHREQRKKYREANREVIQQQMKEYNEANKEVIAEQRAQKYTCVCGCVVRRDSKARHERSEKHIKHLAINN